MKSQVPLLLILSCLIPSNLCSHLPSRGSTTALSLLFSFSLSQTPASAFVIPSSFRFSLSSLPDLHRRQDDNNNNTTDPTNSNATAHHHHHHNGTHHNGTQHNGTHAHTHTNTTAQPPTTLLAEAECDAHHNSSTKTKTNTTTTGGSKGDKVKSILNLLFSPVIDKDDVAKKVTNTTAPATPCGVDGDAKNHTHHHHHHHNGTKNGTADATATAKTTATATVSVVKLV